MAEVKKYKRKKSLKKTLNTVIEIKNSTPKIIFKAELQIKKNIYLNNNILMKNLIINLYLKAGSTS